MIVQVAVAAIFVGVALIVKRKIGGGKVGDAMGSFIMEINDREYTFVYKQGVSTALDLSRKFCAEHGEELGFTEETLGDCVEPLMAEIGKALAEDGGGSRGSSSSKSRSSKSSSKGANVNEKEFDKEGIRQIPLEINGVTYIFEYHDDMDADGAAVQLASEFCSTKGIEIGITPLLEDGGVDADAAVEKCVNPLRTALRTEIESLREEAKAAA